MYRLIYGCIGDIAPRLFSSVYKFTNGFEGWNGLTVNFKKRLTKKIRRFYSEQKTEMDSLNEKKIKD